MEKDKRNVLDPSTPTSGGGECLEEMAVPCCSFLLSGTAFLVAITLRD